MFSQGSEESVVLEYFAGRSEGRWLEIGAWNGRQFSNCHALALRGWGGCAIEPDPPALAGLIQTYDGRKDIAIVGAALTNFNGQTEFHSSNGGGVSTLVDSHRDKWGGPAAFRTIYVDAMTPKELLRLHPGPYQLVSIDVEGGNADLLEMFPLRDVECELLVIEHDQEYERIERYAASHGLERLFYRSPENVIYGR